jgi:hypothetical protein
LSTSLKGPLGMLIAGLVALSLASFLGAALPPVAQAQDTGGASTQEAQQQNNNTNTNTTSETADPPALVVEPGDSLWAIAQERLGAGATPEQIAEEVERIHALNRGRIADDPNLLFPGQELRLAAPGAQEAPATPQPAAPEPAATEPVAEPSGAEPSAAESPTTDLEPVSASTATAPAVVQEEQEPSAVEPAPTAPEEQPADQQPVAEEPVDQEPAEGRSAAASPDAEQEAGELAEQQPVAEEPVGQEPAVAAGAQSELDDAQGRRLLGFGILALTLIAAILGVWRLFMRRPAGDPGAWGTPPTFADHDATPNGANGRGEARGPALLATAEPAGHLGEPRSRTFAQKPYVDRTGMAVLARAKRREAPRRRRPHAKAKFSPNKRRPRSARDPQVRHLLRGVQTNGSRGGASAENRSNGGYR